MDGSRGPGASFEVATNLATEGQFNVNGEASYFDGKDTLLSFETRNKQFGAKVESSLEVLTADGAFGVKDYGPAAGASASLLEIGLSGSVKAFGMEFSVEAEVHAGSIGIGGAYSPTEQSLEFHGSLGAGGSVKFDFDPESESNYCEQ